MRYLNVFNRCNPLLIAIFSSMMISHAICIAGTCPCDIYASGGTPCVAAHSTVRALYGTYNGALYQVKRTSDNKTLDIGVLSPGGFANAAAQDSFLAGKAGTISIIYDQSGKGNHLKSAPGGGAVKTPDKEVTADRCKVTVGGHTVYGAYFEGGMGYRNNKTSGIATGDEPESMYMVAGGKHYNNNCCWDYGNAETTNNDDGEGTMECIYFGNCTGWGKGSGSGPWVMADIENGLWAGNVSPNSNNTSISPEYLTAMVKGKPHTFAIKAGDATTGALKTMWEGAYPAKGATGKPYDPMKKQGAIILGIGGDNSNSGVGTFFEGCMTNGYASDTTDAAVQANIVAAGYGSSVVRISHRGNNPAQKLPVTVRYNPSRGSVVVNYPLHSTQRVSMTIVNLSGRRIATIASGAVSANRHEAIFEVKQIPVGVYSCKIEIDNKDEWIGKIVIGK
jgi:non-reducing end alpha-L-arabinofuranosidase